MFFSIDLLRRKGQFGIIWMAATNPNRISKREFTSVSVPRTCEDILRYIFVQMPPPEAGLSRPRMSLWLSSKLMYGVTVIHKKQTLYTYDLVTNFTTDYEVSLRRAVNNLDVKTKKRAPDIDLKDKTPRTKRTRVDEEREVDPFSDFGIVPLPFDEPGSAIAHFDDSAAFEWDIEIQPRPRRRTRESESSSEERDVSDIEKRRRVARSPVIQKYQSPEADITMREADAPQPQVPAEDDFRTPMPMGLFFLPEGEPLSTIDGREDLSPPTSPAPAAQPPREELLPLPPVATAPTSTAVQQPPPTEHLASTTSTELRETSSPSAEEGGPGIEPSPPEPEFPPLELQDINEITPPTPRQRRRRRFLIIDANITLPHELIKYNIQHHEDTLITHPDNHRQYRRRRLDELRRLPPNPNVLFGSMGRWGSRRGRYVELPIAERLRVDLFRRHCNTRPQPLEDFPDRFLHGLELCPASTSIAESVSSTTESPPIEDSPIAEEEDAAIQARDDTDIEVARAGQTTDSIEAQDVTARDETETSVQRDRSVTLEGTQGAVPTPRIMATVPEERVVIHPQQPSPIITRAVTEEPVPAASLSSSVESYDPSTDEILDNITVQRLDLEEDEVLTFRKLCPPALNTRKRAAILFSRLLELHRDLRVYLVQTPPHTFQTIRYSEIYIYDRRPS